MTTIRHILLVDDDPDDRLLISNVLQDELPGVRILEVHDPAHWNAAMRGLEFDLVITDFKLGWSNGLNVLRRVKLEKPHCPVIMYSSSVGEETAVEAMKSGMHDYVIKSGDHTVRLRNAIKTASEQVVQRKALIDAEIRYRDLFQGIPIGLYQTSPEGRFMAVNQAMTQMLGYPDEKTLMMVHTSNLYADERYFKMWKELMSRNGYVRNLEVEMVRYDGSFIWVEINGKQVYKDGVLFFNEGSLQDITDRMHAQKDLKLHIKQVEELAQTNSNLYDQVQQYNRELERIIDERTIELKQEIAERKKADAEVQRALVKEKELSVLRSQFVSMTSHEFRTPLSSILTSAELLEHYGFQWPREKNILHLQRIQNSVKQIIGMMDDILILGKADAGKLICVKETLQLGEFVGSIAEEMRLNEKFTHTIHFSGEDCTVYGDKKIIRQIITNLLSNALKYSDAGSTIEVSMECRGEEAVLTVVDQGIGIPDHDQEQLFESFYRAGNVGDRPGTGLGLPIVKRSVEAHGGSISIKSKVGEGTRVTVILNVGKS